MKNTLFLLLSLASLCACKKGIKGEGAVRSEVRTVAAFNRVRLEGAESASLSSGVTAQVTVTGYENLLPYYDTEVRNGELTLHYRSSTGNVRNSNIRVSVTVPVLTGAAAIGSGDVALSGFTGNSLELLVQGSGAISAGGCQYATMQARIEGSGSIDARGSAAGVSDALVNGSGTVHIPVAQRLQATVNGSGTIYYYGNPAQTNVSVTGSGRVLQR